MTRQEPGLAMFLTIFTPFILIFLFPFVYKGYPEETASAAYTEELTITVNFTDPELVVAAMQDVKFSRDENFQDLILYSNADFNEEGTCCNFTLPYNEPLDTIYISIPGQYVNTRDGTMEVSLAPSERKAWLRGKEWFTVSSVETTKIADYVFDVFLTLDFAMAATPNFVTLLIDGNEFRKADSTTIYQYENDLPVLTEPFRFRVNRGHYEDIAGPLENGILMIESAELMVYPDFSVSSDMSSLKIIVK